VTNISKTPPDTAIFNKWFAGVLADPAKAKQLKADWRKLMIQELAVSSQQKEDLSQIPAKDAEELQQAIAMVVDHGGKIYFDRSSESSPGELFVEPKVVKRDVPQPDPKLSIIIFHCTFDGFFRHWKCGWGPAKKK
jgi:hypothetical protein